MEKKLIYDWPTRLFHWLFAGMFIVAFFIAKTFDDDSSLYPYHMLIGASMAFIVLLRITWGVVGSRYAKFSSFSLNPRDLVSYLKDILSSKTHANEAHNPASSWIAIIMMFLALGLAVTGYLMTVKIYKEVFEEIHELMANAFVVAAILHVCGVILHTYRYRDGIGMSMLHGKKSVETSKSTGISHSYRSVGVIFLLLFFSNVLFLYKNYDRQKQSLNIFNKSFQLGEAENNGDIEYNKNEEKNEVEED